MQRSLGFAPQELGVYPTLSVQKNLAFFGELAGLRGRLLSERTEEAARLFELVPLMQRRVRTLSGGEKRRVHTAAALLHRPPLLILDEPTAGVDVESRTRVLETVQRLAAGGTAICYSTHYLAEVEMLDASVAILDAGRIIARGHVRDIVRGYASPAIELRFEDDGKPFPQFPTQLKIEARGRVLRIFSENPAADSATILTSIGPEANRVRAIEILTPSLESAFLALTGRRFQESAEADVPAT